MRYGTKKTLPHRDTTRMINIGGVVIGGGNPIAIQSMTNTETSDVDATVAQILELEKAGCQIIRSTANTEAAAKAFDKIKEQIHIPIVADIHFDYRLAILAMEYGADKIRINPGNIGGEENLKKVVQVAKERNIPIRVGVNSGSLERNLVEKYGGVTAEGIVESALDKVRMIEECDYDNLVISIKSSDVMMCVHAHELIAEQTSYPLHVGITEAGTVYRGNIKSAVGLGMILGQGIGDTMRVSLTGDPVEEGEAEEGVTIHHWPTKLVLLNVKNADYQKIEKELQAFRKVHKEDERFDKDVLSCYSKRTTMEQIESERFMTTVVDIFIMGAFLLGSVLVIYLKYESEMTDKKKRNHFLTCIGMSSKEREKLIRTETGIFFWIPAAAAVVMVPVLTGEMWNMREYTKADCVHYLRYLLIFAVIYLVVQGIGVKVIEQYTIRKVEGKHERNIKGK